MNNQEAKADANKTDPTLLFRDFAPALYLIQRVLDYGAQKYSRGSWKKVDQERWDAAQRRHQQAIDFREGEDDESGLPHRAHQIAGLIIMFQREINAAAEKTHKSPQAVAKLLGAFKEPPQDHKQGYVQDRERITDEEIRKGIDTLFPRDRYDTLTVVSVHQARTGDYISAYGPNGVYAIGLQPNVAYRVISKRGSYVTIETPDGRRLQYAIGHFA